MKGPLDRTKVVLRHLPPTISQSNLVEHVDYRFSGRYRWLAFRAGKPSLKHVAYSRAYIDFNKPDDVIEFAEFFDGHVFVNEKGAQFKAIVEYAPSQRVPMQWSKKDGREGTILKDPEYLEFLELISKPVESLPSAEIQLERKESERAGAPKDVPIVTPLMDYIRQKRAAKGGARRTMFNGKPTRRVGRISSSIQASGSSKRGSRKKTPTTMYVLRESTKGAAGKDKSTNMLVRKKDDRQLLDNSVDISAISKNDLLEGESVFSFGAIGLLLAVSGSAEFGKKKILLVKGKGKEISNVSGGSSPQQNASVSLKQNPRCEASGKIIKSILLNRDPRLSQPSPASQSEQQILPMNQEKDKKPPRPPSVQSFQKDANGVLVDRVDNNDLHTINTEKHVIRTRIKDRPDRGVWTPFRRSDGSHASDESLSSSTSQSSQVVDSAEDMKRDMLVVHGGEYRTVGSGRGSHYSDNAAGSYRRGSRRGSVFTVKDADGPSVVEGKPSKRGSATGYGTYEKQVWVQKSSSGS